VAPESKKYRVLRGSNHTAAMKEASLLEGVKWKGWGEAVHVWRTTALSSTSNEKT
jgi:hypothetical protein